jgi:predicted permease
MHIVMSIWRDLVRATRSLAKARAFSVVCVVSLGIGMIPVIAIPYGSRIFTTPPPGLQTDGLVEVITATEDSRRATKLWSYPDYLALTEADTGIDIVGWSPTDVEVSLDRSLGARAQAFALFVSTNYFPVMDMPVAQGTGLRETTDPIVVVSHQFWQRRLAALSEVAGTSIDVNGVRHTITGVAPEHFGGHLGYHEADLFLPLTDHPIIVADNDVRFDRAREWLQLHGRLTPDSSVAQADEAVRALTRQLAAEYPATNEHKTGVVAPYHALGNLELTELRIMRTVGQALTLLPLLVVCLNIAGMVQVRSALRERELSIRQAIGASRARLIQQLLAEAVVLGAGGAALASLVLFNLPSLMAWWLNEPLPLRMATALQVDWSMIAVCVGLCLATSLVFGWLPAARFSRPAIITVLKDDAGGGGRVRVSRVQRVATTLQVAIATPLLILSAMTLDRVRATATDDLGFDAEVLYAAPLNLTAVGAGNAWVRLQGARDALRRSNGVASVAIVDGLPLDFRYRMTRVATQPGDGTAPKTVATHVTRVGDGYFDTLGIPLIRGRLFGSDDVAGAEAVTIVSKPLAERLFPDADPIGRRVTFAAGDSDERTLTIIGVSADFPTSQMSTNRAQLLLPLAQYPDVLRDSVEIFDDRGGTATLMLVARSAPGEPAVRMLAALETAIRDLDPAFESSSLVTGDSLRRHSVQDFMTQAAVAGVVGGVMLLLAALGIYGVVGLMVASRIREIAVRVALGASRRRVMGMVLFDVLKLVAPGVTVGLLIAVAFVRVNGEDFGIALSRLEPLAYVVGSVIAILMAVTASLAPARRAASVQPMVAMRSE